MQKTVFFSVVLLGLVAIFLVGCDLTTEYELNISVMPAEGGEVEPLSGIFEENTTVELEPNPSEKWLFDRWGGANSDDVVYEDGTWKISMNEDKSLTAIFIQMDTVITPIIEPAGGYYEEPVEVSISTPTEGATIHYTLDGTEPDPSHGEVYETSFILEEYTSVKAMAFKEDMIDSEVATVVYDIDIPRWENVGLPGFSGGPGRYTNMSIDNGIIYVAYQDEEYGNGATVMQYDGSWEPLGEKGFSAGAADELSLLVLDGVPYVAYVDRANENKITVKKYDNGWGLVGEAGITEGEADEPVLYEADETLYLAYRDSRNDYRAGIKVFDVRQEEGSWQIFNQFAPLASHVEVSQLNLAHDGTFPVVGYVDSTLDDIGVVREFYPGDGIFTPPRWNDYKEPTGIPVDNFRMVWSYQDEEVFMAFSDVLENNHISVMSFEDSSVAFVGNRAFSEGVATDIVIDVVDGIPFVAYKDDAYGNGPVVMKYDGGTWNSIGDPGFAADSVEDIAFFIDGGHAYIAFQDADADGQISVMKFSKPVL